MIAGTLEIQLLADMAQLKSQMDQATSVVSNATGKMLSSLEKLKKAFEIVAVGFGIEKFAEFIGKAVEGAAALEELSQRTGMTAESLSQLQYAAKVAGASSESLGIAMKKLQVSIANGLAGDQLKISLFKQLGITTTDLGRGTEVVMMKMADAYAHAKDGAGKTALSIGLMGKAGDEMIPFLNRGSQAIHDMMQEADALGLTISTDFAERANDFEDNLSRIRASSQTLAILLGERLVDNLNAAAEVFIRAAKDGDKFHGTLEAIQILLTGTDRQKAQKDLIDLTEQLLKQQNDLDRLKRQGYTTESIAVVQKNADIAATQAQINTTQGYLRQLNGEADAKRAAAAATKVAREEGKQLEAQSKASAAAAQKEAQEYAKIKQSIEERVATLTKQLQLGRDLTPGEQFELKITADLTNAKVALTDAHRKELEARLKLASQRAADIVAQEAERNNNTNYAKEWARDQQDITEWTVKQAAARDQLNAKLQDEQDALANSAASMQLEAQMMGATDKERAIALQQLAIEQKRKEDIWRIGHDILIQDKEAEIAKVNANAAEASRQVQIRADLEEQKSLLMDMEQVGKQLWDDLWSGGHDTLKKLGQDIKKFLLDELYKLVVKPWVMNIAANIVGSGAVQGGASALASGAGGVGGSLLGGMFGAGGLSGAMLGGAGWLTGATTLSGSLAAAGSLIGTGSTAGIMSGLAMGAGALLPIVGGIALIAGALGAFKHGGPKTESGFGPLTRAGNDPSGATNIAQGIQQSYSQLAQTLGLANTQLKDLTVFYAQDPKGTAQTQLQVAGGSFNRMAMGLGFENVGRSDAEFQQAVSLASAQLIVKNLQDAVQGQVGDFLRGIDVTSASLDTLNNALQVAQNVGTLQQALKGLDSVFGNIANASVESQSALIAQAGGVQNLTAQISGFMNDFLTDGEKHNLLVSQLTSTFQQAGITLPATREEYKALLLAQDNNTEAGRNLTTVLLANASAFAQLVPAVQDATDAVSAGLSDTMHGLLIDYSRLRIQLMQLQGDPNAAAYQRSLDTIGFTPGEVAQYDENQRLQTQVNIATKRKQLQDSIYQAEGNTAALRQEELDALTALDPALAAMQQHLYDLQDAAAANATLMSDVEKSRQTLISSYQSEISTLQQAASQAHQFADSITQFKQSLLVDAQLSALNPRGRFGAAQSSFQDIAQRALAGDASAQAQLQNAATTYLQNARNMYGSGTPYTAAFAEVQSVLQQVGSAAMSQATVADQQLAAAQSQLDKLTSIDDNTKSVAQALADYTAAIAAAINAGLNPSNPLNLSVPISGGPGTAGAAANDSVVGVLGRIEQRLVSLEGTVAAGDAMNTNATSRSGERVAVAAARSAWGERLQRRSAVV